ncbi:MAG: glycosyltransferase family 2 protein [Pseudomonadota bacterium]
MASLVICIPTFQRNEPLGQLLDFLQEQAHPAPGALSVRILVIDNNPDARARRVVDFRESTSLPYRIGYVHENRPGVAHVRNRALSECKKDDFLAFIDDDEFPAPGWLAALWKRREHTQAAAVFGSVEALFEGKPPAWMLEGDFHSKKVERDGPRFKPGGTDNCLIDLAVVRELGLTFDTSLSLVGGEDTLFFDGLLQAGRALADAAGAVTYERVPPGRDTLDWLNRRWRRTGMTDALMIAGHRGGGGISRIRAGLDGVVRVGAGCGLVALAWLASGARMSASVARRLYTFQRGLGMVDYARGRLVLEYERGEGDSKA